MPRSLFQRGYADLGNTQDEGTAWLSIRLEKHGFKIRREGSHSWGKLDPKPQLLKLFEPITKDNYNKRGSLEIFEGTNEYEKQVPIKYDNNVAWKVTDHFLGHQGYESFLMAKRVLSLIQPSRIAEVLQVLAPHFFERYPQGRIWYITANRRVEELGAIVRNAALVTTFGLKQGLAMASSAGTPVLRAGHPQGGASVGPSLLALMGGFYPYVFGFVIPRLSSYLIFQLDSPIRIEPRYPWDIYDFVRPSELYGEDIAQSAVDLLKNQMGNPKLVHKRYVHGVIWSPDEFERLLRWWIKRLSSLLLSLLSLTDFRDSAGLIMPMEALKAGLTWDRIQNLTATILTERNSFLRKVSFFQVADLYSSRLSERHGGSDSKAFAEMVKRQFLLKELQPRLGKVPKPFGEYLSKLALEVYDDFHQQLLAGLWDKTRVNADSVRVPIWDRKQQRYRDEFQSLEEYSANVMRTLRNTLHGYKMFDQQFERYLFTQRGSISEFLPDLAQLFLVATLVDPQGLLGTPDMH